MKLFQRASAMSLAIVMTAAMVSGCSSEKSSSDASSSSSGTSAASSVAEVKDVGTLTGINFGDKPTIDMDADYYALLDEITQEKWGFKLRMDYVAWGEEFGAYQTRMAAGDLDFITTGAFCGYTNLASQNAFYDLTPLLDEVPALCEKYGGKEQLLKYQINGKLNYIPQFSGQEVTANANGIGYLKNKCAEWGIAEITDLASLDTYLHKAKEAYGSYVMTTSSVDWITPLTMDVILDGSANGGVKGAIIETPSDPFTAILAYEQPGYVEALETIVKWYNDGIIPEDILNFKQDATELMKTGATPLVINHFGSMKVNILPNVISALNGGVEKDPDGKNAAGVEFGYFPFVGENPIYTANLGNTTGVAVGVNCSEDEARAILKYVEAVHTDKEFFDLQMYGKEGVSYKSFPTDTTVDFTGIESTAKLYRRISTGLTDDAFARKESTKYAGYDQWVLDTQKMLTDKCEKNPLDGFIFNNVTVENQVRACNDVLAANNAVLSGILPKGQTAQQAVDELIKQMKAAGIQDVLDELNAQLKAFKEANS